VLQQLCLAPFDHEAGEKDDLVCYALSHHGIHSALNNLLPYLRLQVYIWPHAQDSDCCDGLPKEVVVRHPQALGGGAGEGMLSIACVAMP
jgi:hypothetical protein